jgi:Flp pilus assembly pilin Flp
VNTGKVRAFLISEDGQDLIEYALLSGIIGAAGALLIPPIVTGMQTSYLAWQSGVRDAWQPCAPGASPCP